MLSQLISAVGLAALRGEAVAAAQRTARRSALYVAMAILWIVALGFLVAALTVWLASVVGPAIACVAVAAGFIVLALVIQVVLVVSSRRKKSREFNFSAPGLSATASTSGPATDIGALAAVAVVGWLLGRQMRRK